MLIGLSRVWDVIGHVGTLYWSSAACIRQGRGACRREGSARWAGQGTLGFGVSVILRRETSQESAVTLVCSIKLCNALKGRCSGRGCGLCLKICCLPLFVMAVFCWKCAACMRLSSISICGVAPFQRRGGQLGDVDCFKVLAET